jgi:hypothetical protein
MLDVVNIGKGQLGGVNGDALMRGIDNIFFGKQFVKSDTKIFYLKNIVTNSLFKSKNWPKFTQNFSPPKQNFHCKLMQKEKSNSMNNPTWIDMWKHVRLEYLSPHKKEEIMISKGKQFLKMIINL